MASTLISELDKLYKKLEQTIKRLHDLEARNRELEEQNENLKREAKEARDERDRVKLDCDYLMVSHKLADNPDSLIDTRRRISQLIRNIDRCIGMLKE